MLLTQQKSHKVIMYIFLKIGVISGNIFSASSLILRVYALALYQYSTKGIQPDQEQQKLFSREFHRSLSTG